MRYCSIENINCDKAFFTAKNEQCKVLCGSTHKYLAELQAISEILVESKLNGRWVKASVKSYWASSITSTEIKILWLKVGVYRILFRGVNGETKSTEVEVVKNNFDLSIKSQKGGMPAFGRFTFPIIIKKKGGEKNNWRFKYVVSTDDGISWSSVREVLVDYELYGDTYSLNYSLFVNAGYGDEILRFKLVDGRDYYSTQCRVLDKERVFVMHRVPMEMKGLLCDNEYLKDDKQLVLYGSESEYSCISNETEILKWEVIKLVDGKLLKAENREYSIIKISHNYLKVVWHNVGEYIVCMCNKEQYALDKYLENSIVYKQAVRVLESDFNLKIKFKEVTRGRYSEGVFPVAVNKFGGAKNNWKFKYCYGIEGSDSWSEEYWHFVDYKRFGDEFEFCIMSNIRKIDEGEKLVVKILEARDYNDTLNLGEFPKDEIFISS